MPLTPKRKRFCEEYVKDLNATQAAIRAGYSERTAKSIGNENLTKPDVQEYVTMLQKDISERNEVTVDDLVRELKSIAFAPSAKNSVIRPQHKLDALDKLMKHTGGYKADKTMTHDGSIETVVKVVRE